MTETAEPKRSEAQLKALKRQVSGIAMSMYNAPAPKPQTEEDKQVPADEKPRSALSTKRTYTKRSPRKHK